MNGDDTNEAENLISVAIEEAEEIRDPLEEIVEKTVTDPGAPIAPDVMERIVALKNADRAAFEALRGQLKGAGCRMTALDEAIVEESGDTGGRGPKQADILIALAHSADLFHAPDGRIRRRRHQRPSRNLADPQQRLQEVAGALFLRSHSRRTEFGSPAVGAQCDRGQVAFRCARTYRLHPRRRVGRPTLPRSW